MSGITACSLLPKPAASPSGTQAPATNTPTIDTPAPQATPDFSQPTVVTETRQLLTIWMPTALAPASESASGVLERQIRAFAGAQVDLDVRIEYKTVSGPGGILNYLRTGRSVAPGILPDLIVLPMNQLATSVADELIFPLNGVIEPESLEDLYPVALDFAVQEDQILGYPFSLTDFTHLAYNTNTISQTIATDWEMFRTLANGNFVFPANGEGGATFILQMYLSAGGTLTNDAGQLELVVEPLAQSLEQLNLARNEGFLVRQSNTLATFPQSWELYEAGSANVALLDAHTYLTHRGQKPETAVSPLPGLNGEVTPLVSGWAWAISTNNNNQQALASTLLKQLISPELMAEWSIQTSYLPARRGAFEFWLQDDPYTKFVQEQLEIAEPHPFAPGNEVLRTLRTTVVNVVNLTETPQEAAEAAIDSLNP